MEMERIGNLNTYNGNPQTHLSLAARGKQSQEDMSVSQLKGPAKRSRSQAGSRGKNIRPYVFEIDQLIRLYRSGERSKFELTSAITNFLNEDRDLSPKERNESFELYLAEVDSLTLI